MVMINITIATYNVRNLKRDFFSELSNEFVTLLFDADNFFLPNYFTKIFNVCT